MAFGHVVPVYTSSTAKRESGLQISDGLAVRLSVLITADEYSFPSSNLQSVVELCDGVV